MKNIKEMTDEELMDFVYDAVRAGIELPDDGSETEKHQQCPNTVTDLGGLRRRRRIW